MNKRLRQCTRMVFNISSGGIVKGSGMEEDKLPALMLPGSLTLSLYSPIGSDGFY